MLMRLLIITQKIDINDDILGFFHRWLEKFAEKFEKIIAICLQKGEYNLPANVKVLSLRKEKGKSKLKYIWNFYKYILVERKQYDAVFVHMNQEYVLFGSLFWKLLDKNIFMWRNHRKGNIFTRIAVIFCSKVFYTSEFSFTARFKKSKIMPVGIDIKNFQFPILNFKSGNNILSLGRISPVKNIHILIEAINILSQKGMDFILNIVGEPTEKDDEYFKKIKEIAKNLEDEGKIKFFGKTPNYKTPEIYAQNSIFVNLTKSGSMDKTILEAMAAGLIVLVCNKSFENIVPKEFIFEEDNVQNLAEKIEYALKTPQNKKDALTRQLRKWVEEKHGLDLLISKLIYEFKND